MHPIAYPSPKAVKHKLITAIIVAQPKVVMERNIHVYDENEKWLLPEQGALMSARFYKDKKAVLLVEKLKETIKVLTIKCAQLTKRTEN